MAGARKQALGIFSSQCGRLQGSFPVARAMEDLARAGGMELQASPRGLCKGKSFLARVSY